MTITSGITRKYGIRFGSKRDDDLTIPGVYNESKWMTQQME